MTIVIWLIYHQIVILCENGMCNQISSPHFNYLLGLGTLETVFELWAVVKIYLKKKPPEPDKKDMKITYRGTKKW